MDLLKAEFDPGLESLRLGMLLRQFPELADICGEVRFAACDDEARLSHASWSTEGDWFAQAGESGVKLYLMELLDSFIQYRAQCYQAPWQNGIVYIDAGSMRIEWLAIDDVAHG